MPRTLIIRPDLPPALAELARHVLDHEQATERFHAHLNGTRAAIAAGTPTLEAYNTLSRRLEGAQRIARSNILYHAREACLTYVEEPEEAVEEVPAELPDDPRLDGATPPPRMQAPRFPNDEGRYDDVQ